MRFGTGTYWTTFCMTFRPRYTYELQIYCTVDPNYSTTDCMSVGTGQVYNNNMRVSYNSCVPHLICWQLLFIFIHFPHPIHVLKQREDGGRRALLHCPPCKGHPPLFRDKPEVINAMDAPTTQCVCVCVHARALQHILKGTILRQSPCGPLILVIWSL